MRETSTEFHGRCKSDRNPTRKPIKMESKYFSFVSWQSVFHRDNVSEWKVIQEPLWGYKCFFSRLQKLSRVDVYAFFGNAKNGAFKVSNPLIFFSRNLYLTSARTSSCSRTAQSFSRCHRRLREWSLEHIWCNKQFKVQRCFIWPCLSPYVVRNHLRNLLRKSAH